MRQFIDFILQRAFKFKCGQERNLYRVYGTDIANDKLNNSYITIVADEDPTENIDTRANIIMNLRDKLSDTQQVLNEKVELVRLLEKEIETLHTKVT